MFGPKGVAENCTVRSLVLRVVHPHGLCPLAGICVNAAVILLVVPETSGELSDWHLSRMTLLYVFIAV
jgi:hypothetical protein